MIALAPLRAVRVHALAGVPVVLGEEGRVIERRPEELLDRAAHEEYAADAGARPDRFEGVGSLLRQGVADQVS